MKFFPHENFLITSELLPDAVIERIKNEIGTPQGINFKNLFAKPRETRFFSGYIFGGTFSLTPIVDYRNSFLPQITGAVMPHERSGSIVQVKMALNTAVLAFMCVWLGGLSIACAGIIIQCIMDLTFSAAMLIPLGMFAFGYVLMTGAFKLETNNVRKKLLSITQGVIEK